MIIRYYNSQTNPLKYFVKPAQMHIVKSASLLNIAKALGRDMLQNPLTIQLKNKVKKLRRTTGAPFAVPNHPPHCLLSQPLR